MGVLILTGIAVNDAILKVDFMRRYFAETGNLDEAIKQAGIHRFRTCSYDQFNYHIRINSNVNSIGDGYILRQSLAIALMGGMVTSTLLTLYLIPMVFRILNKKSLTMN